MSRPHSTINLLLLLLATSLPITWLAWRLTVQPNRGESELPIKMQIGGSQQRVDLQRNNDGQYHFVVDTEMADQSRLSPDEFAEALFRQQHRTGASGWMWRLFNISSPLGFIWVSIGLLGQVLFTGRMVVQWLLTERNRQSIVPPAFWWMSLGGALMLLSYFMWRRDIVGVLGQSFGLIVYVRNLYFIYQVRAAAFEVSPAPER